MQVQERRDFRQESFLPSLAMRSEGLEGPRLCQSNGVGYSPFAVSSAKAAATSGRSSR